MRGLLAEHWDEPKIIARVERIESMIEPHLGPSQRRFIDGIDDIIDFVEQRRADILAEIDGGMPLWDRKPRPPIIVGGR